MQLLLPPTSSGLAEVATCGRPRTAAWSAFLATLALAAVLALLAAYVWVLLDAVQQGELRRAAAAQHSAATWRCNALKGARLRAACLHELNRPSPPQ